MGRRNLEELLQFSGEKKVESEEDLFPITLRVVETGLFSQQNENAEMSSLRLSPTLTLAFECFIVVIGYCSLTLLFCYCRSAKALFLALLER